MPYEPFTQNSVIFGREVSRGGHCQCLWVKKILWNFNFVDCQFVVVMNMV